MSDEIRNRPTARDFERVFAKVADDIERHGWSVMSVFEGARQEGEQPTLPFSYTIGLRDTFGHPELLLVTLDHRTAHGILNGAGEAVKDGVVFKPGERYDKVLERFQVLVHEVPEPGRPLNVARRYHGKDESALQIVWPDPEGRFPGEPGYDQVRWPQPLVDGDTDGVPRPS